MSSQGFIFKDRLADLIDVDFTSVARGDILYRGETEWNNLTLGTEGQVLEMIDVGAGALEPRWSDPAIKTESVSGQTIEGPLTLYKPVGSALSNLVLDSDSSNGAIFTFQRAGIDAFQFYVWSTGQWFQIIDSANGNFPIRVMTGNPGAIQLNYPISIGGNLSITDTKDVEIATGTGTKIGTASNQKIGFWGATPVVRPAANVDTTGLTVGQLETEVNQMKQLLRDVGLMAP